MNRVISLTFALLLALLATGGAKAQSKEFEAGKICTFITMFCRCSSRAMWIV